MNSRFNRLSRSTRILGSLALALAALAVTQGVSCPGGPNPPADNSQLFVVNNNLRVTSYAAAYSANGAVLPTTRLEAGATTNIFQPRSVIVSKDGRLLVSRQNGGLTVHNNAKTATGDKLADRTVDGAATLLSSPIAFAYDKTADRLYVGDASAAQGILVFDTINDAAFTGDKAPSRKFNPSDRAPTNNMSMTINALDLDANGRLYVADTSGLNQNSSRVIVFNSPSAASGSTTIDRTITCTSWGVIQDLAVDSTDHLYVVDGTNKIFVFDNASNLGLLATPSRTLTINGANSVSLQGILIGMNGAGFVADTSNSAVHSLTGIAAIATGTATPATTITGFDSAISSPRQMFLYEP